LRSIFPVGPTLQEAFNRFTASLQDGDIAVVYFSGHAGRVGGEFTLLLTGNPPLCFKVIEYHRRGLLAQDVCLWSAPGRPRSCTAPFPSDPRR
jgi:hypothetical protein